MRPCGSHRLASRCRYAVTSSQFMYPCGPHLRIDAVCFVPSMTLSSCARADRIFNARACSTIREMLSVHAPVRIASPTRDTRVIQYDSLSSCARADRIVFQSGEVKQGVHLSVHAPVRIASAKPHSFRTVFLCNPLRFMMMQAITTSCPGPETVSTTVFLHLFRCEPPSILDIASCSRRGLAKSLSPT